MELRTYWRIVRDRLAIVLALPLLVGLSYPLLAPEPTTTYAAGMRFVIGVRPEDVSDGEYTYDRYYTWLTAEYLVDDLAEVVKSRRFAEDVARRAAIDVGPGTVQGATSAGKLHRILNVTITWPDPAQLDAIAAAVQEILVHDSEAYFAQLDTEGATVSVIDPPVVYPVGRSLRDRIDLPLRLALALAAGVAVAFLLDYLDDSVRGSEDLAALDVPVLAEVPRRGGALGGLRRRNRVP